MVEVFKYKTKPTSKDVDEIIRREVFILFCSQLESLMLFTISTICVLTSSKSSVDKFSECLMITVLVVSICVLINSKLRFNRKIKEIIINNKQIIYSCKEIKLTKEYVYITNVPPMKMSVEKILNDCR